MANTYEKLGEYNPSELPDRASNLTASEITNTTLVLNWTNHTLVSEYPTAVNVVQVWIDTKWVTTDEGEIPLDVDEQLIFGLDEGTNYRIRVCVLLDNVLFPSIIIQPSTLTIPKPQNITVDTLTLSGGTLHWDGYDPTWENVLIQKYLGSTPFTTVDTIDATETSYVITDMGEGEQAYYTIGCVVGGVDYSAYPPDFVTVNALSPPLVAPSDLWYEAGEGDYYNVYFNWTNNNPTVQQGDFIMLLNDQEIDNINWDTTYWQEFVGDILNNQLAGNPWTEFDFKVSYDASDGRDPVTSTGLTCNIRPWIAPFELTQSAVGETTMTIDFQRQCEGWGLSCNGDYVVYFDGVEKDRVDQDAGMQWNVTGLDPSTTYDVVGVWERSADGHSYSGQTFQFSTTAPVVAPTPTLWWTFDNTLTDEQLSEVLVLRSGSTVYASGYTGADALVFDLNNPDIYDNSNYDWSTLVGTGGETVGQYTESFWYKANENAASQNISNIFSTNANDSNWIRPNWGGDTYNYISLNLRTQNGGSTILQSNLSYPIGEVYAVWTAMFTNSDWHHVMWRIRSDESQVFLKVWHDGVAWEEQVTDKASYVGNESDWYFILGNRKEGTAVYFDGAIQNLKIYNSAITDAEANKIWEAEYPQGANYDSRAIHSVYAIQWDSATVEIGYTWGSGATTGDIAEIYDTNGDVLRDTTAYPATTFYITSGLSGDTQYKYAIKNNVGGADTTYVDSPLNFMIKTTP